jgi:hypothetical protein
MKKLFLILVIFLCIPFTSAAINITEATSLSSINWGWNKSIAIDNISVDGYRVMLFDTNAHSFILTDLKPNETHDIRISSVNDTGYLVSKTLPEITKSSDKIADFIFEYLLLFICIIMLVIGIRVPVISLIGLLFGFIGLISALIKGDFMLDMIFSIAVISCGLVTYIGVKR